MYLLRLAACTVDLLMSKVACQCYFVVLDVEVSRDDSVSEIFMDPTGDHVVISMMSEINFYLHRGSKTLRQLSKFNVSVGILAPISTMFMEFCFNMGKYIGALNVWLEKSVSIFTLHVF